MEKFQYLHHNSERNPKKEDDKLQNAKRELFRTLGLQIDTITSPQTAPSVVDFALFWKEIGIQASLAKHDLAGIPRDYEIYIGADYKPRKKEIVVTEVTEGEELSVTPDNVHFIEMHNEPDDPSVIHAHDELHDNLPDPYYGDMIDFLTTDIVFCSIIIRMIDNKTAGIVLALKTDAFDPSEHHLKISSDILQQFRHKIYSTLENDDVLILRNGVAVYRGFVDLPPKKGKSFLRLRKPD